MIADEILANHEHRPFPLPNTHWLMRQEWHDLLFAHWPVDPGLVRRVVPSPFELDLWSGEAYVGVVPFVIRNLRPRGMPAIPVISHFAEINVRTYVRVNGVPGVYFFSLDAANLSAVLGARLMYALPYYHARFKIDRQSEIVHYESCRRSRSKPADFRAEYHPISDVLAWRPPQESLERFVSERYCLYAINAGHVYRTHIHHLPWPLRRATANIELNTMAAPLNLELQGPPPLLHFAKFIDVLVWWPERVR